MFIYYFTYAHRPMENILDLFSAEPDEWVSQIFQQALEDSDLVRVRLGVGERIRLSKEAWVQLGEPEALKRGVLIPIRIQVTGAPMLFPTLEGEIEIAAIGGDLTQLMLRGNYTPPIGAIGDAIDKVLLHRVVESSIKHFVEAMARSLEGVKEGVSG